MLPSPLRPVEFEVLLTLATGERHGYSIIQETDRRTDGQVRLETATVYRALKRLVDIGYVTPTERRPAADDDERRRYYRLTARGRTAAVAEAGRLARLVASARAARLIPGRS
ncbi:MAG: PadR family transcriptional regulator [Gemmatimonadales bacterium]